MTSVNVGEYDVLYQFNEMQKLALSPVRMAAQIYSQLLKSPFNPVSDTPQAQTLAAGLDLFSETTQYHGKPAFGLTSTNIDMRTVAVTEEIVHRKTFCQLKHFKRDTTRKDPKLLIVAPMSGHFATLLRGTVETMMPNHDVYITDWRDAANVPVFEGRFDLDDYIDYIIDYLEILGPDTHVMAVCQPGVPVLAAVALMSEDNNPNVPLSVTLMGSPIDTRRHPTEPCKLAMNHSIEWFEHTVISHVPLGYPGAFRRVYPGFLQLSGFVSMNFGRHMEAHIKQFDHLVEGDGDSADRHRAFYAEYNAVMDLTAEYYLQTIETVFQKQALAKGEMMYRGDRLVRTDLIKKTALMTVEGELDDISGIGQTVAAHDICTGLPDSMKTHYEQKGVGHYGVFNGSKFRSTIAPRISDFILNHEPHNRVRLALVPSDETKNAPAKPAPAKPAEAKAVVGKAPEIKPAAKKTASPETSTGKQPEAKTTVTEAAPIKAAPAKAPAKKAPVKAAPAKATPTKSTPARAATAKSAPAAQKTQKKAKPATRARRQPTKKA
ncbi:polyhydroxyalkanoate depolymerase [uncultured Sneathiella sp.]|uniref:polyhydroxyalkanoate depolymerase n=1 Tax=uncultured Sneathiella sp. TaxID=879315 RepID=UPI00259A7B96|nr:polyhydroxyalkanoate depolymerase [uncultured Sneathiella sp.]